MSIRQLEVETTIRPNAYFGFRARFVPRIGIGDASDKLLDDVMKGQQSFWEALQFNKFAIHPNISVELRYVAHETSRQIEVWLLFDVTEVDCGTAGQFASDIERMLPKGFGWEAFTNLTTEELPTPDRVVAGKWWTSRAVRRLVFADIPEVQDVELTSLPTAKDHGRRKRPARDVNPEPRRYIVGFEDRPGARAQRQNGTWAIPLIMAIRTGSHATPAFFEELQAVAPAALSIRVSRLSPERLPALRSVANHYLEQKLGGLSVGIEGAYGMQASSYHRYLLPDDLFNLIDIGFATAREETTESLCHLFCSQIGGLTGFCQADIVPRETLLKFATEYPMSQFLNLFLKQRRDSLADDLERFGAEAPEDDAAVENFMLDAPYVYTFHEALSVLQLPLADDRGLPGIDSRPIAPFNSPAMAYDPVVRADDASSPSAAGSADPNNGIRIGVRGKVNLTGDGKVQRAIGEYGGSAHWHRIRPRELTKHALIVGTTGSGKTMVTSFLTRELVRLGIPFCIVEPVKSEYFAKLSDKLPTDTPLRRFNFEGTPDGKRGQDFFVFDPLRLPHGVTVVKHVSFLKSAWQAAFPMDILGSMLLENGLLKFYTDPKACAFGQFTIGGPRSYKLQPMTSAANGKTLGIFPSFGTFKDYFLTSYLAEAFASSGRNDKGNEVRENAVQFFNRRFALLEGGLLGESMRAANSAAIAKMAARDPSPLSDNLDHLFRGSTVLELDAIPDNDDKALVMAFILTRLFEIRQAAALAARETSDAARSDSDCAERPVDGLRHVLIIEEAHRLLDASSASASRGQFGGIDPKAKAISLFVDLLAEIRAFGQGIVIVEQIPTKIVPEAIKNTNLKIMLRMPSPQDREALGQAMNLTDEQIRYVATLRANPESGIDFVAFEEQLDQPILLNLPLPDVTHSSERCSRRSPWLFDEFF